MYFNNYENLENKGKGGFGWVPTTTDLAIGYIQHAGDDTEVMYGNECRCISQN